MIQKRRTMHRGFAPKLGRSLLLLAVWISISATVWGWWKPPVLRFTEDAKTPVAKTPVAKTPADESTTLPTPPPAVSETPEDKTPQDKAETPENPAELPDVNPSSLRGVTPGLTSLEELKERWGESQKATRKNGVAHLFYQIAPFAGVEVEIVDDLVSAIQIELAALAPSESITKELALDRFRGFDIPDKHGVPVGRVFPERGVTYTYAASEEEDQPLLVSRISLEPTTADFFVLRVIYDSSHFYQDDLSDLDYAQLLDPEDARAYWLKAKIMHAIGQQSQALVNVRKAVQLQPKSVSYRLTLSDILIAKEAETEAQKVLQTILTQGDVPADLLASAHILLGEIDAKGMQPNFETSVEHFMEAVRLAKTAKNSDSTEVHRNAQMALIQANLGAAYSIAVGDWKGKMEMAPRWIHQGKQAARDVVENDRGDIAALSFLVLEKSLEAYAAANGEFDPAQEAQALLREGERIVADAQDPLYKKELQWRFGLALFHAAEAQHIRGRHEAVKVLGNKALKLLVEASAARDADARHDYLFGRLYFYVGAALAIGDEDQSAAARWYERAIEFLDPAPMPARFRHGERHGERFVSMGLTYWEVGKQTEAIELTLAGLQIMQQAAEQGKLSRKALVVPLGNLSKMHQTLGKLPEAQEYARQAKSILTAAKTPTRR